jgi:hypothetical protein
MICKGIWQFYIAICAHAMAYIIFFYFTHTATNLVHHNTLRSSSSDFNISSLYMMTCRVIKLVQFTKQQQHARIDA